MAKVKIQGHASGTGVLTITAPNTSTDRTITLPDSTATIATTAQLPTISATAPSSPAQGDLWFNSSANTVSGIETKVVAVYNGTAWKMMSNEPFDATGGTITSITGYKIHTFTSSGTFTPNKAGTVDALVIAGGGSGAADGSTTQGNGGGGAGGMYVIPGFAVTAQAYTITIGAGGVGDLSLGEAGNNSSALGFTALKGGGGGYYSNTPGQGGSGYGSGGGGGFSAGAGGTGNNSNDGTNYHYGNDGRPGSNQGGGGGGGAGATGSGRNAGVGRDNNYRTGSNITYAGGGGGGKADYYGTANGGGGSGNGDDADANTGGGGASGMSGVDAGNGGSGIVVIRYAVT